MTEEIIIDGIDVSKCEAFIKTNNTCYNCYACEGSDCYFKQLKRKEQENKELKEVKEQLKKWNDENLKRQDDMQKWIDLAEEQRRKYRSALEEIRILATKNVSIDNFVKIQNKINEVLK